MTCPKCNKAAQAEWLFCPFCQNPLKEKCPECGEMEWIGRIVCKSLVDEARTKQVEYLKQGTPDLFEKTVLPMIVLSAAMILFGAYVSEYHKVAWITKTTAEIITVVGGLIGCASIPAGLLTEAKFGVRSEAKKRQKFLQKFPEYAEILEKAKSAEAESSDE